MKRGEINTTTFVHDDRSRLTQYAKDTTTASYLYDAFGRRIRKTVNGASTWFLWDGMQMLAEYSLTGARTKRYGYLPGHYVPTQLQDVNGAYYVHSDHLQTPRFATNAVGQIVWRSRHEAFGKAIVENDADGDGVPVAFNLRFPGQYYDAETGLHYNYFRDYDPGLGRFLEQDPIGQAGGVNLFAYARGNPLRWIDPLGLDACNIEGALEAERERKDAENEKILAQLLGDDVAYENAKERIDGFIRDYDAAMRGEDNGDAPPPPRITPTPPPQPIVAPPPPINY